MVNIVTLMANRKLLHGRPKHRCKILDHQRIRMKREQGSLCLAVRHYKLYYNSEKIIELFIELDELIGLKYCTRHNI